VFNGRPGIAEQPFKRGPGLIHSYGLLDPKLQTAGLSALRHRKLGRGARVGDGKTFAWRSGAASGFGKLAVLVARPRGGGSPPFRVRGAWRVPAGKHIFFLLRGVMARQPRAHTA